MKTPYYKIKHDKLESNFNHLYTEFIQVWSNFVIGYSFKTNTLPWIINWMKDKGAYAEVVSKPEYLLAKHYGFKDNKIIINGPHKGYDVLRECLINGSIVNLDSFHEIDFILKNFKYFENEIKIGLRINFDLESFCPNETIPGDEPGRFGFNLENGDFIKAVNQLKTLPQIKLVGLHGHHSTKTKSLKIFETIAVKLCEQSTLLHKIEYLDLGGCFFGDKPGAPTFKEYAHVIVNVFKSYSIDKATTLIMEPGAAIIASPISYICSVIDVKKIRDTIFVTTDGSSKHIDPQMNNIKFCVTTNVRNANKIKKQVIAGYTCIEMDRFALLVDESELKVGDLIEIHNTGAYSMSLAPLFIEMFPAVYVESNNILTVVREPWDINCFIQKSIV